MVQDQWLQLNVKFLLGCNNMKIFILREGMNLWWWDKYLVENLLERMSKLWLTKMLTTTSTQNVTKLQELKTHISICHLNTESMTSTFDEFQLMVNESKFYIMTLSETWLKNDKYLLEYVSLPGYKFSYRNKDEKRDGGVDVYIKDCFTYKIRNDIISLKDSLRHLWVEVKGKNKKSHYLIGVVYQPSSENAKKI